MYVEKHLLLTAICRISVEHHFLLLLYFNLWHTIAYDEDDDDDVVSEFIFCNMYNILYIYIY